MMKEKTVYEPVKIEVAVIDQADVIITSAWGFESENEINRDPNGWT